MIVDLEMQNRVDGQRNLTTGQAWSYFRNWDPEAVNAVAVPWPEEIAIPDWLFTGETIGQILGHNSRQNDCQRTF